MTRHVAIFFLCVLPLFGQSRSGELHVTVTDPSGLGVKSTMELVSDANQYRGTFTTDDTGNLAVKRLPYGVYRIQIEAQGFAPASKLVEIRSAIPTNQTIALTLAAVTSSVTVKDTDTLVDPHRSGSINQIGSDMLENRPASLPGRSLQDLVNSQPGWLYEGNAVLHPRGSEYQTQFVMDGVPFTDNRSPSFAPEI